MVLLDSGEHIWRGSDIIYDFTAECCDVMNNARPSCGPGSSSHTDGAVAKNGGKKWAVGRVVRDCDKEPIKKSNTNPSSSRLNSSKKEESDFLSSNSAESHPSKVLEDTTNVDKQYEVSTPGSASHSSRGRGNTSTVLHQEGAASRDAGGTLTLSGLDTDPEKQECLSGHHNPQTNAEETDMVWIQCWILLSDEPRVDVSGVTSKTTISLPTQKRAAEKEPSTETTETTRQGADHTDRMDEKREPKEEVTMPTAPEELPITEKMSSIRSCTPGQLDWSENHGEEAHASITAAKSEVEKRGDALRSAIEVLSGSEWYHWEKLFTLREEEVPGITWQVMSGIALLLDDSPQSASPPSRNHSPLEKKEDDPQVGTPVSQQGKEASEDAENVGDSPTPNASPRLPSSHEGQGSRPELSTTEGDGEVGGAVLCLPNWNATMACFLHEQFPQKMANFDVLRSLTLSSLSSSSPSSHGAIPARSVLPSPQKEAEALALSSHHSQISREEEEQISRRMDFLMTHLFSSPDFTYRNASKASTLTGRLYKWLLCHVRYFRAVMAYRDALAGTLSASYEKSFEWSSVTDASLSLLDPSYSHEVPVMKLLLHTGKVVRVPRSAIYAKLVYGTDGNMLNHHHHKILDLYKDQINDIRKLSVKRWRAELAQPSIRSSSAASSIASYGSAREWKQTPERDVGPVHADQGATPLLTSGKVNESPLFSDLERDEQLQRQGLLLDQEGELFELHVHYVKDLVDLYSVGSDAQKWGLDKNDNLSSTPVVAEDVEEGNEASLSHLRAASPLPSSEATRRTISTSSCSWTNHGGSLDDVGEAPMVAASDGQGGSEAEHSTKAVGTGVKETSADMGAGRDAYPSVFDSFLYEEVINRKILYEREAHQWLHILSEALNGLQETQRTQRLRIYAKDMEKSRSMCREMQLQCMQSAQELCDILNADLTYGGLSSSVLVRHVEDVCSRLGDISDFSTADVSQLPEDIKGDLQDHFSDVRQSVKKYRASGLSSSVSSDSTPTLSSGLGSVDVVQDALQQNLEIKKITLLLKELRESQDVPSSRIELQGELGCPSPSGRVTSHSILNSTQSSPRSQPPRSPTIVAVNTEEEEEKYLSGKEENDGEEEVSNPLILSADVEPTHSEPMRRSRISGSTTSSGQTSSHRRADRGSLTSPSTQSSPLIREEGAAPPVNLDLFDPTSSSGIVLHQALKHAQELLLYCRSEGRRQGYMDSPEKKYADEIEMLMEEERAMQQKNGGSPDPFSAARMRVLRHLRSHMLSLASADESKFLYFQNVVSSLSAVSLTMLENVPLNLLFPEKRQVVSPVPLKQYTRTISTPFCDHAEEYLHQLRLLALEDLSRFCPMLEVCISHLEVRVPTPTTLEVRLDVLLLPLLGEKDHKPRSITKEIGQEQDDFQDDDTKARNDIIHNEVDQGDNNEISVIASIVEQVIETCEFNYVIGLLNDPLHNLTIPDAFRETALALQYYFSQRRNET